MSNLDQTGRHLQAMAASPSAAGPGTAGRIVVRVDGSESSLDALKWALQEGVLRHAAVHTVLTWTMPPVMGMAPVLLPPDADVEGAARANLDAILQDHFDLIGERPADSPVTSAVLEGAPALGLLAAAVDASLLVVGSRGRGGFAGLLLGSVSQQCTAHAACPVVVVHATDH